MEERVIVVDEHDRVLGSATKSRVHQNGTLHRAFSIFVYDRRGNLLLQRRARGKYHSGGKWSNTCCGHPRPGEPVQGAAHRRLAEEMGFDCPLEPAFTFVYHAELDRGTIEHEFDHVFVGHFDGDPTPDPAEAEGWRWIAPDRLKSDRATDPDAFTVWFGIALDRMEALQVRS